MRIGITDIDQYFLDSKGGVIAYFDAHGVEPYEFDEWRKWKYGPLKVIGYAKSSDAKIIIDGSLNESLLVSQPKVGLHPVFVSRRGIRISDKPIKSIDEHFELPKSASR